MRITAPGNLLLLGEYAVLEPGGLGLALAVEKRVRIETSRSDRLVIAGTWGREEVLWTEDAGPDSSPLLTAVVEESRDWIRTQRPGIRGARPGIREARWEGASAAGASIPDFTQLSPMGIVVDSTALFTSDGIKAGYGSSAAVAIVVSANSRGWASKP